MLIAIPTSFPTDICSFTKKSDEDAKAMVGRLLTVLAEKNRLSAQQINYIVCNDTYDSAEFYTES